MWQNQKYAICINSELSWSLEAASHRRLYTAQWHIMGDYWLYGQNLLTTISNDIFKSIHSLNPDSRPHQVPGTSGNEYCILDGNIFGHWS